MSDHILTLRKAENFVAWPEFYRIFNDWNVITEVEYDALEYLVNNAKVIMLPNVKVLSADKIELLRKYKHYLNIGFEFN